MTKDHMLACMMHAILKHGRLSLNVLELYVVVRQLFSHRLWYRYCYVSRHAELDYCCGFFLSSVELKPYPAAKKSTLLVLLARQG